LEKGLGGDSRNFSPQVVRGEFKAKGKNPDIVLARNLQFRNVAKKGRTDKQTQISKPHAPEERKSSHKEEKKEKKVGRKRCGCSIGGPREGNYRRREAKEQDTVPVLFW